jgi:hypothetical protein
MGEIAAKHAQCSAGPIETEIWGDTVRNAESTAGMKSPFIPFVKTAHKLAEVETRRPGWFLPPAAVGEKVWKVG